MSGFVVDYAFPPHPPVAALAAAGAVGVCRYLSYTTPAALPKVVTVGEWETLTGAGLAVVLNWEFGAADFTHAAFDAAGAAREALRQARALGYPDGCAIYYSVDLDVTASQWPAVRANFQKVNSVHGVARTGIYGPWDALEWASRDQVATWFWQAGMSTAWSAGRNRNLWPGAHLRQHRSETIGGADCDINEIVQAAYGQHQGGTAAMQWTNPATAAVVGGRDPDTLLVDLWSGEQRDDSAFAHGTLTLRQSQLGRIEAALAALKATPAGAAAPTQEQVNQAVLVALLDTRVQEGLASALAAHLHIT